VPPWQMIDGRIDGRRCPPFRVEALEIRIERGKPHPPCAAVRLHSKGVTQAYEGPAHDTVRGFRLLDTWFHSEHGMRPREGSASATGRQLDWDSARTTDTVSRVRSIPPTVPVAFEWESGSGEEACVR